MLVRHRSWRSVLAIPALVLALLLFTQDTSSSDAEVTSQGTDISGDADCDQDVDSVDSLQVLREVAGLPAGSCLAAADVDCDGDRDIVDALLIQRHVASLPVQLPKGCPPIGSGGGKELKVTFAVDPSVEPMQASVPGIDGGPPRPLSSIADERGSQADFVRDELLITTDDKDALDAFLDRWNGDVLAFYDPDDYGLDGPRIFLVHIDTSLADAATLEEDIRALDELSRGAHNVASQAGLDLLGAAAAEGADGMSIGVNWVAYGDDLREETTAEAPTGSGPPGFSADAYDWDYFDTGSTQDMGVTEAWTALAKTGNLGNTSEIAILDGGFAPDADFPGTLENVGPLNSMNPLGCGSGNPCPWHGTNVLGAAMGVPDNAFGAAGVGGPVAEPIVIHKDWDIFNGIVGVAQAAAQGADVINMSWGAGVPASLSWSVLPFSAATEIVSLTGTLIFASAGNSNKNVDAEDCFIACWEETWITPCENAGVVCVGALAQSSLSRASYSNYGSENVDIFAPGTTFVGPDPANPGNIAQSVSGTSFSSPFMAGAAALVWAANPTLSAAGVRDRLYDTAREGPGRVERYVHVWGAVRSALGGNTPPDLDIITPNEGQSFSRGSALVSMSANASDPEDGTPDIEWVSSRDGMLGTSTFIQLNDLSFGAHTITATATDSGGFTDFESVNITILNDPPIMNITTPANGAEFFRGQTINLSGTSLEPNNIPAGPLPNGLVSWRRDGSMSNFAVGHNATIPANTLSIGSHTITFRGSDGALIGLDTITINVNPDPADLPPSPVITAPPNGSNYDADEQDGTSWYKDVTLQGSASDPEDGNLTGADLVWTTSINGGAPVVLGTGTSLNAKLRAPMCFGNTHVITLTATDSFGNSETYSIQVTVSLFC